MHFLQKSAEYLGTSVTHNKSHGHRERDQCVLKMIILRIAASRLHYLSIANLTTSWSRLRQNWISRCFCSSTPRMSVCLSLDVLTATFPGKSGLASYIGAKDDGSGATRRAKLQSNCHRPQSSTGHFTGRMPFLAPNQQRQSRVRCLSGKHVLTWSHTSDSRLGRGLGCSEVTSPAD